MNPVLHTYPFGPGVTAFSTTRQGGFSEGNYASFNINRYCGDNEEHIRQNRQLLCRQLGITDDRLIMPHQVHLARTLTIDEAFLRLSETERLDALEGYDALMTNLSGVCIGVSTADCIPILLYDEEHHAVAAVHAGWRGTVQCILKSTISSMISAYGSRPECLRAVIGPGISLESFEVGDEVYETFREAHFDMATISRRYPANKDDGQRWHIDLPECNRQQLLQAGLQVDRILMSGICTYQQADTWFSARRLGIQSGRIFTGIII